MAEGAVTAAGSSTNTSGLWFIGDPLNDAKRAASWHTKPRPAPTLPNGSADCCVLCACAAPAAPGCRRGGRAPSSDRASPPTRGPLPGCLRSPQAIAEFRAAVADIEDELAEEEGDDEFIVQKYLNAKQWDVPQCAKVRPDRERGEHPATCYPNESHTHTHTRARASASASAYA